MSYLATVALFWLLPVFLGCCLVTFAGLLLWDREQWQSQQVVSDADAAANARPLTSAVENGVTR
ncbi:MAG: hypothetical protein JWM31_32 [Solirubrobacterales bacterium]|nr:hypothetical protein [Solirubrobacterales bacterium]